jgi:hypothetical protein
MKVKLYEVKSKHVTKEETKEKKKVASKGSSLPGQTVFN